MITTEINQFYHFYPSVAAVIGAKHDNQVNFMAAAWHSGVSHTPPLYMVSIAPKRFTHDMIMNSGEFTCNFLPLVELNIIHGTGIVSGADTDKIPALGIELVDSVKIECPVIKQSYAAYECQVIHQYPAGDHNLFIGEVVAVHWDESQVNSAGVFDPGKVKFSLYQGQNTYITTDSSSVRVMPSDINQLLKNNPAYKKQP